jgi:hypothetical protein
MWRINPKLAQGKNYKQSRNERNKQAEDKVSQNDHSDGSILSDHLECFE